MFSHKVRHRKEPLVRGFDDYFLIPHSRYTEVPAKAIHACRDLRILADGSFSGEYHDSDMGDCADDYLGGTLYYCAFTGRMNRSVWWIWTRSAAPPKALDGSA